MDFYRDLLLKIMLAGITDGCHRRFSPLLFDGPAAMGKSGSFSFSKVFALVSSTTIFGLLKTILLHLFLALCAHHFRASFVSALLCVSVGLFGGFLAHTHTHTHTRELIIIYDFIASLTHRSYAVLACLLDRIAQFGNDL